MPLAVVTFAVYWPGVGRRPNRAAEDFVQRHHGGAGIDHEADALAVDAALGGEMTARVAGNAEAAEAGLRGRCGRRSRLAALVEAAAGVILFAICAMKVPRPARMAASDHNVTHDATLAGTGRPISPRRLRRGD